jgi:hypothetical protein
MHPPHGPSLPVGQQLCGIQELQVLLPLSDLLNHGLRVYDRRTRIRLVQQVS